MAQAPYAQKLGKSPTLHTYDALVMGGQLGGVVAAALLAKRGYRVAWIEHDGLGEGYEHKGYLLPYAPFLLPAVKASPAFESLLNELAIANEVQRAMHANSCSFQWLLPKHRVNLYTEASKLKIELQREFGDEASHYFQAFLDWTHSHHQTQSLGSPQSPIPPCGPWETFKLQRQLQRLPPSNPHSPPALLENLKTRLLPFLNYSVEQASTEAFFRPLSQCLAGTFSLPLGRHSLREILCRRFLELGGTAIRRDETETAIVEELMFEGKKFTGARLTQSGNEYRAQLFISATDTQAVRRLIRDPQGQKPLTDLLASAQAEQFLFTLNQILPNEALPVGLGESVFVDLDETTSPFLLQVMPAQKVVAKGTSTDETLVCAGMFVPVPARDRLEAQLQDAHQMLGNKLAQVMPFAKNHLKLESSPYFHAHPLRGSRLLPHPRFRIRGKSLSGLTGLPPLTPSRQWCLASREVLPGLGFEGELLAGQKAARFVQDNLPQSRPWRG